MKKSNKILMATVAILLSLVLISTSIVSGIFARFVIEKSGSTAIKFNKFGVELGLEIDQALYDAIDGIESDNVTLKQDGDSISVEISNIKMAPGDAFYKAFNISISGTPTVDCRFKLDVDLIYEFEKFLLPTDDFDVSEETNIYFPIRFSQTYKNNGTDKKINFFGRDIAKSLFSRYGVEDYFHWLSVFYGGVYFSESIDDGKDGVALVLDCPADEEIFLHPARYGEGSVVPEISFNDFYFGFEWIYEVDDLTNLKDAYIVKNNPDGIGFSYIITLSLEQTL